MAKSRFDVYRKTDRSLHGRLMPLYVGITVALIGGAGYLHWRDRGLWQRVPAQVLSVSVEEAGRDSWQPAVTYQYTIDGNTYRSSHVAPFGFPQHNRERVVLLAQRFQESEAIVAYVNPRNPKKAYLIPGTEETAKRFFLGIFGMGAITVLIAAIFLLKTKPNQTA